MDILTAIAILSIGVLLGLAMSHLSSTESEKKQLLSKQLDDVHAEYAAYQEKVDEHFKKSADILTELSKHYGSMHQHLAMGMHTLSKRNIVNLPKVFGVEQEALDLRNHNNNEDVPCKIEETSVDHSSHAVSPIDPPKDYAFKPHIDEIGTLSEHFKPSSPSSFDENESESDQGSISEK